MHIGDLEIVPVRDGTGAIPPSVLFAATEEQWLPHRQFLDDKGMVPMEVGGFLIRGVGERVVLVDLGLGPLGSTLGMAQFLDSLGRLGVTASDVTDVLLTHLHIDHIGWATVDGAPTFPNATYHCDRHDWAYFVDPGGAAVNPLTAMIGSSSEADLLAPIAGRVELWEEGTLLPGLDVTMAPGHTPGSTVIVVSSGTSRALLLGDVAHCPVELVAPEWEALSDVDPALARRTRDALAREYEGTDIPMAAAHFAGMQFGRLLPGRGRRQWVFDDPPGS
jgi:glyoxylase-like metal-dependent hydrolase (beta-lactamase superfamily II)